MNEYGVQNPKEYHEKVDRLLAIFETNLGIFEVGLFVKICPEQVWHFVNIVEGREETISAGPFLEGITFRQIVEGQVNYFGRENCPIGKVKEEHYFNHFGDEPESLLKHDCLGILCEVGPEGELKKDKYLLTMSKSDELDDEPFAIGLVIKGIDVVEKIGSVFIEKKAGTTTSSSMRKVIIKSVTIARSNDSSKSDDQNPNDLNLIKYQIETFENEGGHTINDGFV